MDVAKGIPYLSVKCESSAKKTLKIVRKCVYDATTQQEFTRTHKRFILANASVIIFISSASSKLLVGSIEMALLFVWVGCTVCDK